MFGFKTFAEKQIEAKGRRYDNDVRRYRSDRAEIDALIKRLEGQIVLLVEENARLRAALKKEIEASGTPGCEGQR